MTCPMWNPIETYYLLKDPTGFYFVYSYISKPCEVCMLIYTSIQCTNSTCNQLRLREIIIITTTTTTTTTTTEEK